MSKILLFALLAVIVYLVLKSRSGGTASESRADRPAEKMVACARCGVNVPRSEAIEARGLMFCCSEHSSLGPR